MSWKELEDTLTFSWTEKKGQGGFLTYDNGVEYDDKEHKLVTVAGKKNASEIPGNAKLKVVVPISLLNGMDGLLPLAKIGERLGTKSVRLDHLMLLQNIVIKQCVLDQWDKLHVTTCDFEKADQNKDAKVVHKEFVEYLRKSHPDISQGVMELFWENLDENQDGLLDKREFLHRNSKHVPQNKAT